MSDGQTEFTLLDIFAGIGGFSLAFDAAGFRTIGQVEFHPTKRLVLDHWFPEVPKFGDIDQFDCGEFLRAHGRPDVIAGGPPCQASSLLGERLGTADHRWKWPEAIRLARELRPRYCVFENPPGVLSVESGRAFNGIVSEMAALGYDCMWDVIPAAAFGAGHWRERLCIVFAEASGFSQRSKENEADTIAGGGSARNEFTGESHQRAFPADANDPGLQRHAGNGFGSLGRAEPNGSIAARHLLPDLRGRVTGPDWWHEVNTGISVLRAGLPGRLVEAISLCIGDSVVPAAWLPIAQAIHQKLKG